MPNKTIYVSDSDLPLYERAQELAGGNLSAAIAAALHRFIEIQEARKHGYDEVTVPVGFGRGRKVRFSGVLLGEWQRYTSGGQELFRVYRTPKGKFAVYVQRSDEWAAGPNNAGGWRGYLGFGAQDWTFTQGRSTLDVVDSLDELRDKIPAELYDVVGDMADQPTIEDLDI